MIPKRAKQAIGADGGERVSCNQRGAAEAQSQTVRWTGQFVMKQWYVVYARGHHGYPQPEDDYSNAVYRAGVLGAANTATKLAHFGFLVHWLNIPIFCS
jgi:hypothetical protein